MHNKYLSFSQRVFPILGIGLVSAMERQRAKQLNNVVSCLYIVLSIILLLEQSANLSSMKLHYFQLVSDWLVWVTLFFCYALMLYVVEDTRRFIVQNWLLPIILFVGVGLLARDNIVYYFFSEYRSLLAIIVFLPALNFLVRFFIDGRLWTTLAAALAIVIFFGLMVASIDPGIKSAEDGVWWALATVSTVGYGDVVPSSLWGRLIGGVLVVVGLGLFVVITANFLSIMLRNEKHGDHSHDSLAHSLNEITSNQDKIKKMIKKLQAELDNLK